MLVRDDCRWGRGDLVWRLQLMFMYYLDVLVRQI